jgi:hypothetical protein
MEKNVRRNPFANTPEVTPVKTEPGNTIPPKQETTKTTAPPKFRNSESEAVPKPISKTDIKPTPQVETNHYTDETNDISNKEFESLSQFNASKSFLRLTTEKLPANASMLKESALPFALTINPIAYAENQVIYNLI